MVLFCMGREFTTLKCVHHSYPGNPSMSTPILGSLGQIGATLAPMTTRLRYKFSQPHDF